ncbi:MAG TPA: OmpA family protein [Chryseosolibacter sp.]|nr:OmpA family protein [Chryseosolibacter sp.]
MRKFTVQLIVALSLLAPSLTVQAQDSLIYAEGRVVNAQTREPITARITYQSLPYGNKIGVINNNQYSFPMFDGEKYSIVVEASGYAPAKYMLDPQKANGEKKVVQDIELSNGTPERPTHPVGEVMRLNNLIFEVGKSKIDPESYTELDLLAQMMNDNPAMIIQLEGHTDYLGDPKENLKLSQQRVQSVKDYLNAKGIPKTRLKTKAFGGMQPLSRENTPEAHRLNRRVEVRILQN